MRPFRFVRSMQEWTFSTTTRSVELINIALLTHLLVVLLRSDMTGLIINGVPLDQLRIPVFAASVGAIAAAQLVNLLAENCIRCRKTSGLLLCTSSLVWLFLVSVITADHTAAAQLGLSKSFVSVYVVCAALCYLSAEVIREYVKSRTE